MVKILFVCLGNICRSPMAEALMNQRLVDAGLNDQIFVDSAATASYHIGKPPHEGTINVLKKFHIPYEELRCRSVTKKDFINFDYIIGMDESNIHDLKEIAGSRDKIMLLSDFLVNSDWTNVPDPWYTGDFDHTYQLVDDGTKAVFNYIVKKHKIMKY